MRIDWTLAARSDLDGIVDYIARDNPVAARAVETRILSAAARLQDLPYSARPGRVPGTRELVTASLPYILVYSVESDRVAILRVLHTARQWPPESG